MRAQVAAENTWLKGSVEGQGLCERGSALCSSAGISHGAPPLVPSRGFRAEWKFEAVRALWIRLPVPDAGWVRQVGWFVRVSQ